MFSVQSDKKKFWQIEWWSKSRAKEEACDCSFSHVNNNKLRGLFLGFATGELILLLQK